MLRTELTLLPFVCPQDKLSGIEYVQTFQELKLRWEQNQEYAQQARGGAGEDNGLATEDANQSVSLLSHRHSILTATHGTPSPLQVLILREGLGW